MERGDLRAEEEHRDLDSLALLGEQRLVEDVEERRAMDTVDSLNEESPIGVSGVGQIAAISSSSDRGQLEVVLDTLPRSDHFRNARLEGGLRSRTSPLATGIMARRQNDLAEQAEGIELNEIDRRLEGVQGMLEQINQLDRTTASRDLMLQRGYTGHLNELQRIERMIDERQVEITRLMDPAQSRQELWTRRIFQQQEIRILRSSQRSHLARLEVIVGETLIQLEESQSSLMNLEATSEPLHRAVNNNLFSEEFKSPRCLFNHLSRVVKSMTVTGFSR